MIPHSGKSRNTTGMMHKQLPQQHFGRVLIPPAIAVA